MLFVQDNFIVDEGLVAEVVGDKSFFPPVMSGAGSVNVEGDNLGGNLNEFHYEQADCFAPYMFWDGWWRSPADTPRKRVIEKIWRDTDLLPFKEEEVCGFEYWTRTFSPGQWLGIHVDEDTFMYSETTYFQGPKIGCVWYGFSEADGGFLEIHEDGLDEGIEQLEQASIERLTSPADRRERIKYQPNRLVVFDAGHKLHETTPVTSGIKQVMVVNVWHADSPPWALSFGGFYSE